MARWKSGIAVILLATVAIAATVERPGMARQPLPTPRGQLGGREPLQPTHPAGVVMPPAQVPRPTALPAVSAEAPASSQTVRMASTAAEAARSTLVVRAWRDGEPFVSIGWVWDDRAHVVNAAAAVEDADRLEVTVPGSEWIDASPVGLDETIGLAVLAAPGLAAPPLDLPASTAVAGDPVAAVDPRGAGAIAGRVVEAAGTGDEALGLVAVSPDGPTWPSGAPVIGVSGLVGMALPVAGRAPAVAAHGSDSRDRLGGPARGSVGAYVPIWRISDIVPDIIDRQPNAEAVPTPARDR